MLVSCWKPALRFRPRNSAGHEEVRVDHPAEPIVDVGEAVDRRDTRIDRHGQVDLAEQAHAARADVAQVEQQARGAVRTARSSSTAAGTACAAADR